MEKRSHRRIRDLDVLTAFQGLVANEIGCARISMMASEQETLPQWAEYRCARPIISRSSHPACTARPVHTKYMARRRRPPSQGWSTFLRNHADGVAAMDLFVVPTISFRLLYGLLILRHDRRRIRGAPHRGLARLMSRINCRISNGTFGLPERGLDFQRQ